MLRDDKKYYVLLKRGPREKRFPRREDDGNDSGANYSFPLDRKKRRPVSSGRWNNRARLRDKNGNGREKRVARVEDEAL